jgi:integrase
LLEPSIADAIAAVDAATELSAAKRAHWACSLRQIAKWLGVPAESLAARWTALHWRVNQLHHARLGIERKTLANHVANLKAALLWYQGEQGLSRRGTPLMAEWTPVWAGVKNLSRKAKLSGLVRYCSIKGIIPEAVNDLVVDEYMHYRAATTALAVDTKARRAIARAWNSCIGSIAGWPSQPLTEPPLKTREGPHWTDFPVGLQQDLDAYLMKLTKPRWTRDGKRLRPCKPLTIKNTAGHIKAFAKMAVRAGTPIEELVSFRVLLHPDIVRRTLDAYWERDGEVPGTFAIDLPKRLIVIARQMGCLDEADIEILNDIRTELESYRRGGLTEKNRKLVREVLTGDVWKAVVQLPGRLMAKARALQDQAPLKAAITAQLAVAIAILTVAPVRVGNLVAVKLGENLVRPGGPQSPYWMVFPEHDVKNRVDLSFSLPPGVTALIDEYIHGFRGRLIDGADSMRLFPGPDGDHKTAHLLSIQIKDRVKKETGLTITPHQFRHAAAAIFLKHNPGQYETLRRLLGQRNIRTTTHFYSGLETIQATETYGQLIETYLDDQDDADEVDE